MTQTLKVQDCIVSQIHISGKLLLRAKGRSYVTHSNFNFFLDNSGKEENRATWRNMIWDDLWHNY